MFPKSRIQEIEIAAIRKSLKKAKQKLLTVSNSTSKRMTPQRYPTRQRRNVDR
jgi:hypothetical protein